MSKDKLFRPDGWGTRARIGLITPHMDIVPEAEFQTMATEDISIHVARVPLAWRGDSGPSLIGFDAVRSFAEPPFIDDAVEMLATTPLNSIAYGFTSSGYLLGPDGELELSKRLVERAGGVPVVFPCQAACIALHSLGLTRVAMVNPAWFPNELTSMGVDYFRKSDLEVVFSASATNLAQDQLSVTPKKVYEWVIRNVPESAEAIFLGGGGLRAIGAIEILEKELNRPVLTANQVIFWHALRVIGDLGNIEGYGKIFNYQLPA